MNRTAEKLQNQLVYPVPGNSNHDNEIQEIVMRHRNYNNKALRETLLQIAKKGAREQLPLIEALRPKYGHSVVLVEEATCGHLYSCYQYAFELVVLPPEILKIEERRWPTFRHDSPEFVAFLMQHKLGQPEEDCVVLYFKEGQVKHAGRVRGEFVVSKWGRKGHLWRHRLCEVPIDYGSDFRFFKPITQAKICRAFLRFAKSRLGSENFEGVMQS